MVIRLPDIRVPSGCKMPATVAFKSGQDSCHRPVKLIVTKQRAFGVTKISLKRAVKRYREEGPKGFYRPRGHRGPAVLTPAVLGEAQRLLDEGLEMLAAA